MSRPDKDVERAMKAVGAFAIKTPWVTEARVREIIREIVREELADASPTKVDE